MNRSDLIRVLGDWIWGAREAWRRAARDTELGFPGNAAMYDMRARTFLDAACGLARRARVFDAPELLDLRLYAGWCEAERDRYRQRGSRTEAA